MKPDNVLLRSDGLAKLADFGLAKDFDDDQHLTKAASGLGTPHFMAPEQYEDAKNATALSDVYSLGATLYCTVTGRLPFENCKNLLALVMQARGTTLSPRDLAPGLSEHVDAAIRQAMSPDPAHRPATCLKFVELLAGGRRGARKSSGAANARTPAPDGAERRVAVRHRFRMGTSCVINTGASGGEAPEDWPTKVVDLSESGVGIVLARRFEPGAKFAVEMEGDESHPAVTLRVRVVRVRPETLGHWFHGCKFLYPLPEEDLQALLG